MHLRARTSRPTALRECDRLFGVCAVLALGLGSAFAATKFPEVTAPPAELHVPAFYKKFISAEGYPIVASERVNDYALKEAAHLVNLMLARRPDVRRSVLARPPRSAGTSTRRPTELSFFIREVRVGRRLTARSSTTPRGISSQTSRHCVKR